MIKISQRTFASIIIALLILFGAAALSVFFSGCKISEEAAINRIEKINSRHPMALAVECVKNYPNEITRQTHDTTIIKGDSQIVYEQVPCPDRLLPNSKHDTVHHTQYVRVPYKIAGNTTIYIKDTVFKEDSARVVILRNLLNIETKIATHETDRKVSWRRYCLIFGGILALLLIITLIRVGAKLTIPKLPF